MTDPVQQKVQLLEKKVGPQTKSPLFAQLASLYITLGRAEDALRVCDRGIALFPFYTTGHLIKAKALLALKMNAEARRELEFVLDFFPHNGTIAKLLRENPSSGEFPTREPAAESAPPAEVDKRIIRTSFVETVQPPIEEPPPQPAAHPFEDKNETEAQPAQPAEDPFGFGTPAAEPPTADSFTGLTPAESEVATPSVEASPAPSSDAMTSQGAPSEEESFEEYAARKRGELNGMENSLTLDDYLGGLPTQAGPDDAPSLTVEPAAPDTVDPFAAFGPPPEEAPKQPDNIEELAQKLQGAKKITPVINLSERAATPASESETPAGAGFVTPTLAEIYAKQGWYDDAIKAYKALATNRPAEREKFEKRIQELEDLKKQSG